MRFITLKRNSDGVSEYQKPNEKQREKIEMTAKEILEAREKFHESSLADFDHARRIIESPQG